MAIYHCHVKIISRGTGRSSVSAAAYRAGEKLYNRSDDITHDYINKRGAVGAAAYRSGKRLHDRHSDMSPDFTTKSGIVYSEILLPENAPQIFKDRETLWNSVEETEKHKNAQVAREVEVALPCELNTAQQIKLVQEYVRVNFVNAGMCVDFSTLRA
jgi:hypothetical protein